MHFEHSLFLFFLLTVPLLVWIFVLFLKWKTYFLKKFGDPALVLQLLPGYSAKKNFIKFGVPLCALILILIAIANPQSSGMKQKIKHEGIDLAIVLDVSNSMLAEDVSPNRLEVARQFAARLIEHRTDDRIALITFAGVPQLQLPLTEDHSEVQLMLKTASTENTMEQGSDLGAAILEAVKALPENQNHYKAIVLISDGEDHEEQVKQALKEAQKEHIMICTAGTGTLNGKAIPVNTGTQQIFKRDDHGQVVLSKLIPSTLQQLARETNGIYTEIASEEKSLQQIIKRLNEVNNNMYDEQIFAAYDTKFQWLVIPALLCLIFDLFISNKKSKWFS